MAAASGTAVYIGYNNDMQNLDRALCNRLPGGACDPDNTVAPRAPNMLNDGADLRQGVLSFPLLSPGTINCGAVARGDFPLPDRNWSGFV